MKFPIVMEFKDLNLIDSLESAKKALKGLSGIYCIKCIVTGTIYIGSSINMAKRLVDHVVDKDTNVHLQNAINNYGLENFVFVVVEFYEVNPSVSLETNKANLLALEQSYLDWLFTLPESLRYNFISTAGSSLGYKHTEDTLDKMSGENNSMYGKVPANAYQSGANNPMYGRTGANHPIYGKVPANAFQVGNVPTNAMTINVYDPDNVLVRSFTSQVAAANWLKIPRTTFQGYLSSGKVWNNQYTFRKSS